MIVIKEFPPMPAGAEAYEEVEAGVVFDSSLVGREDRRHDAVLKMTAVRGGAGVPRAELEKQANIGENRSVESTAGEEDWEGEAWSEMSSRGCGSPRNHDERAGRAIQIPKVRVPPTK
jgi:hypothetical protein